MASGGPKNFQVNLILVQVWPDLVGPIGRALNGV